MKTYLVESHHTAEDYARARALKQTEAAGYFTHFEWGCKDGVHCGWAMFEAESPAQALLVVPTFLREKPGWSN